MHHRMKKSYSESFFFNKIAPQARLFYKTKCAAGKTYQTKCAVGQIFWLNPAGWSVLLIQYVFYFSQNLAQHLFSLIHQFINKLVQHMPSLQVWQSGFWMFEGLKLPKIVTPQLNPFFFVTQHQPAERRVRVSRHSCERVSSVPWAREKGLM